MISIQWLLVTVVAIWGAVTGAWRASPVVFWTLVALFSLGNIALIGLPLHYFYQPVQWMNLFVADSIFIGASVYCMVGFDTALYLPYFLILLVAALTRGVATGILVGVAVSAVYTFLVWMEGGHHELLDTGFLIRLPFFIVIALFTGYLANGARSQREAQVSARMLEEQVSSLQRLAAGVAHEVRNPLTAISNNLQVLMSRMPDGVPERAIAREALDQVARMTRIVQETLDFAKPAALKPAWTEVGEVLDRAARDIIAAMKAEERIKVSRLTGPRAASCWADAHLLEQAFGNLLRNAVEAMPDGGRLELETGLEIVRGVERVSVRIADTGCGIPPHQLERLFQPFYTTKERGTGLGLGLARKYLRAHGGDLEVASTPGQGTVIRIHLPVSGPPFPASPSPAEAVRA